MITSILGACWAVVQGLLTWKQRSHAVQDAVREWTATPTPRQVGDLAALALSRSGFRRGWVRNDWKHVRRMERAIEAHFGSGWRGELPQIYVVDHAATDALLAFLDGDAKVISAAVQRGRRPFDFHSIGFAVFYLLVAGVVFSPLWHNRIPGLTGILSTSGVLIGLLIASFFCAMLHAYFGAQLQRHGDVLVLVQRRFGKPPRILGSFHIGGASFVLIPTYSGGPMSPRPDESRSVLHATLGPDIVVRVEFERSDVVTP